MIGGYGSRLLLIFPIWKVWKSRSYGSGRPAEINGAEVILRTKKNAVAGTKRNAGISRLHSGTDFTVRVTCGVLSVLTG